MTSEPQSPTIVVDHPVLGRLEFETVTLPALPYWALRRFDVPFDDGAVRVSICFYHQLPSVEALDPIARALSELPRYAREARQAILGEGKARDLAQSFKEHVFEFETHILLKCLGVRRSADIDMLRFIESLKLVNLFVQDDPKNPDDPVITFGYSIDSDISAHLNVSFSVVEGRTSHFFSHGWSGDLPYATSRKTIDHPVLGLLEFDANVANTALKLGDISVPLDITFPGGHKPTTKALARSGRRVADLAKLDTDAREAIAKDLALGEGGQAVYFFKTHHFEELDAGMLAERFGVAELTELDDARFVAGLELLRVGLYPKDRDATFVCDYSLGADLTQYVIAVKFDNRGRVRSLEMES